MATLVWLFVALIISQSYTASLTSMLTVQRLEPKVANIETLRNSNAVIGYSKKAYVKDYLLDVLHFNPNNIKNFSSFEECAEDLKTGKTAGVLLEIPTAKVFQAKYCKSFTTVGPTYKAGGYGFVIISPLICSIKVFVFHYFYAHSIYLGHLAYDKKSINWSQKIGATWKSINLSCCILKFHQLIPTIRIGGVGSVALNG